MSQLTTCLLGATVDVVPDAEISANGVNQQRLRGTIVNVFQMPPNPQMPHFMAPHYSVLVGKEIIPVVPPCRVEVIEVPSLHPSLALAAE